MSDLGRHPILQSGFVSLTEKGLVRLKTTDPTIREAILMNEYRRDVNKYFYSNEITALFNKWSSKPELIRDFDFREKVLRAAFSAFATPYTQKWLLAQTTCPTVTKLHRAYLLELLAYLMYDDPRTIEPIQWVRLLEASEKSTSVTVDLSEFIGKGEAPAKVTSQFSELIRTWVSKPNGFTDLLVNIYIIFGDREQRSDVADLDAD